MLRTTAVSFCLASVGMGGCTLPAVDAPSAAWSYESRGPQVTVPDREPASFHVEDVHVDAFFVPVAFLEVDEDDNATAPIPDIDVGQGWGARVGFGDRDQSVGVMYTTTSHDERVTGIDVRTHAAYLDFLARRLVWQDGDLAAHLSADAALGVATIDTAQPFEDLTGVAAQLRGTLDLEVSRAVAFEVGFGGFVWGYFGDTHAFGTLVTVGGRLSF